MLPKSCRTESARSIPKVDRLVMSVIMEMDETGNDGPLAIHPGRDLAPPSA